MKLVRLALREPKDGALEAREAKVISVALAPALCRTGVGILEAKSAPMEGWDGWRRLRSATLCRGSLRYGGKRVSGRVRKNHRKA
jgi:hypothetical protein